LQAQGFDFIELDLGLPDVYSLELLRGFRRLKVPLPIMVLKVRDGVNDRITGIKHVLPVRLVHTLDRGGHFLIISFHARSLT